uniref:Uncharacterized protein n=1 Tax=Tetranychus urticae TaxID=32264 RepID=T1JWX6_TETUR
MRLEIECSKTGLLWVHRHCKDSINQPVNPERL